METVSSIASPRKPGARQLQILQTLATMLEDPKGEKVTTAALAARLGVSEAALYRHFASKAQMYEGLIEFIETTIFGGLSFSAGVRKHELDWVARPRRPDVVYHLGAFDRQTFASIQYNPIVIQGDLNHGCRDLSKTFRKVQHGRTYLSATGLPAGGNDPVFSFEYFDRGFKRFTCWLGLKFSSIDIHDYTLTVTCLGYQDFDRLGPYPNILLRAR